MTKSRRWPLVVRDAHGRKHRGVVTWSERIPATFGEPRAPAEFTIALLSRPSDVKVAAWRTAVCVPGIPRQRALRPEEIALPRNIADLSLPPHRMAEYASGRIVMPDGLSAHRDDIFPTHADRPRLDVLALLLVEAAEVEATAPYIAVIRRELMLRPNADALGELGRRLAPEEHDARPPARAPGIVRLARVLRCLRQGAVPDESLEQLTEDLRFLRLFEREGEVLSPEALNRLLGDVLDRQRKSRRGRIVPIRRKGDAG
jgi:hypothetical protein